MVVLVPSQGDLQGSMDSQRVAMTQSGGISKAKNEVVVRRGEVSKTTEMVQQKSESVR